MTTALSGIQSTIDKVTLRGGQGEDTLIGAAVDAAVPEFLTGDEVLPVSPGQRPIYRLNQKEIQELSQKRLYHQTALGLQKLGEARQQAVEIGRRYLNGVEFPDILNTLKLVYPETADKLSLDVQSFEKAVDGLTSPSDIKILTLAGLQTALGQLTTISSSADGISYRSPTDKRVVFPWKLGFNDGISLVIKDIESLTKSLDEIRTEVLQNLAPSPAVKPSQE